MKQEINAAMKLPVWTWAGKQQIEIKQISAFKQAAIGLISVLLISFALLKSCLCLNFIPAIHSIKLRLIWFHELLVRKQPNGIQIKQDKIYSVPGLISNNLMLV